MAGANGNIISRGIQVVRNHRMFSDSMFSTLTIINASLGLLLILFTLLRVRPDEFVVIIRYSTVQGLVEGNWLSNYNFVLFALLATIGNSVLAAKAFSKHRLVSFTLLVGGIFVQLLALVIVYLIVAGNTL